ncbi:MAG: FAD-dependent oxidoreductase, partial [Actinomycetota bacterium]
MSEGAPPLRVVIVGFGPVGARLCEELLPAVKTGSMALTVIGAESDAPYNRVLVAELAVDRADAAGITLHDPQESMRAGVDVRLGTRAVSVDRTIKQIELSNGERVAYDRLVLATGARANIPTLTGI